ncbi:MAG: hypothetical protein MJ188_05985 [Treponema sp.]|nr:hypothetical protein [Treponema sp.]
MNRRALEKSALVKVTGDGEDEYALVERGDFYDNMRWLKVSLVGESVCVGKKCLGENESALVTAECVGK